MSDYDENWWTTEAMLKYGEGFVKQLSLLYRKGDLENQRKIKATWPEYWKKYKALGLDLWEMKND